MKTFTEEQINAMMQQAKTMLEGIEDNQSVRDIMARHYVDNLDDKTLTQGQVMADAMLEAARDFDVDYKNAVEDLDGFIRKFQKEADEGKTCVERCNYWLRLAAAVSAAGQVLSDSEADREQILSQLDSLSVSEEEATVQLEEELRQKARNAIKESGILLTGIMANPEVLEEIAQADDTAELLIDLGNEEIEYRALVAMLAYTQVKTGQMENIPVEITAVQLTRLVCAQVEQTRILNAVGIDYTMEVAQILLTVLGVYILMCVMVPLTVVALHEASQMFGCILMIPAVLMVMSLYTYVLHEAADAWSDQSKRIVKKVKVAVMWVVKGIREMADYVKVSVLPDIKEKAKAIFDFLVKLTSKPKNEEQTAEEEILEEDDEIFVEMDDQEESSRVTSPNLIALT